MDVAVFDGEGLPDKAFLSVRIGEVKKMGQFKDGVRFHFESDESAPPRHLVVDVFEKVASKRLTIAEMQMGQKNRISLARRDGCAMSFDLELPVADHVAGANDAAARKVSRVQETQYAKKYLEAHDLSNFMQDMMQQLLRLQPEDPLKFMGDFLRQNGGASPPPPEPGRESREQAPPAEPIFKATMQDFEDPWGDTAEEMGAEYFGPDEHPGFSGKDCPATMPDISKHHSLVADVLRADPTIYDRMRKLMTPRGTTFGTCVKPTFDTQGHPMIKMFGAVAGDALCYDVFGELFDPIIAARHGLDPSVTSFGICPPSSSALARTDSIEDGRENGFLSTGRVLSARVKVSRNFEHFRFAPACDIGERRDVERIIVRALRAVGDECKEFRGDYFPVQGSLSFTERFGGMTMSEKQRFRDLGFAVEEPDSEVRLSSGFGRHWPDARGIYVGANHDFHVVVNEEDHFRAEITESGDNIRSALGRMRRLLGSVELALRKADESGFARSDRLGFLTTDPGNLGTAFMASVSIRLSSIGGHSTFRALCKQLKLQVRSTLQHDVFELCNAERMGSSEVDQVNAVIDGSRTLLERDWQLSQGQDLPPVLSKSVSAPMRISSRPPMCKETP